MRQASACMSQAMVPHRILQEQNQANPIATILSAAMMLRYSLNLDKEADAIEAAVKAGIEERPTERLTLCLKDAHSLAATEMGDAIAAEIQ